MATLNVFQGVGTHLTDGILVEPQDPAYARAPFAVDAIKSGVGVNNAQQAWGPCSLDWGGIFYAALFDASGNQIVAWALPATYAVTVSGNNALLQPAGAVTVTLGPAWASNLVLNSQGMIAYQSNGEPVTS